MVLGQQGCGWCGLEAPLKCGGCGEVRYCCREHQRRHWTQHKSDCRSYTIASTPEAGHYLIASRHMRPGYLFLWDEPIIEGPLSCSSLICLGCHMPILDDDFLRCPQCQWPVCCEDCATSRRHMNECFILARDFKKCGIPYKQGVTPRYDVILLLRCLLLRSLDPPAWEQVMAMESHGESRSENKDPYHVAAVRYVTEVLKVDFDVATIHHVRGAMVTNGLEIRGPTGSKIRALYAKIRLFNHSCLPNVHLSCTPAGIMEARTAVQVSKGEPLHICYTGTPEPFWKRQSSLLSTYYFNCNCVRCSDPTELGTHFSSPRCPECPQQFLHITRYRNSVMWICQKCGLECDTEDIREEIDEWITRLDMDDIFGNGSPHHVSLLISKAESTFHVQHYVVLRVYQKALQHLRRDSTCSSLKIRQDIWHKLLQLYNVLEPGLTRRRGMTLYEAGTTILALLEMNQSESDLSRSQQELQAQDALNYLKEAREIFCLEPKGTPESELAKKTAEKICHLEELVELRNC